MTLRPVLPGLAIVALAVSAQAQPPQISPQKLRAIPVPAIAASSEQRVLAGQSRLTPQQKAFVASQGAAIASGADASEGATRAAVGRAGLGNLSGADIDMMVQLVMMQAAQDATDDLRAIMEDAKAENARKAALRSQQKAGRDGAPPTKTTLAPGTVTLRDAAPRPYTLDRTGQLSLQAQSDQIKRETDSLGEVSEVMQTRLQAYMDRRAKIFETLSNLLRKASDTQSGIAGNIK